MNRAQALILAGRLFGLMLLIGSWSANGQPAAPTETRGVMPRLLVAIDLGPEIEGMAGRQLRARISRRCISAGM